MISVVVPAHDEARVIERCLRALLEGAEPGTLEVIVVCNGCRDDTAAVARRFGDPVRVVEIDTASKIAALNTGDTLASSFPRFYVDADVELPGASLRAVARSLSEGGALVAAPRASVRSEGSSRAVRAFYRCWEQTPYVSEGMIGCGVYALSESGRRRFDVFPDVIADDAYVRALFPREERAHVEEAAVGVWAPLRLADLIKAKTRSRLGLYELKTRFPRLAAKEQREKSYLRAALDVMRQPQLWACFPVYLFVNAVTRIRARRQFARLGEYRWERDDSTRSSPEPERPNDSIRSGE